MALLPILQHPDPRLREIAKPVEHFDRDLKKLIDDLFETMYDAPGVGLAATQVGIAMRLAVMDCSEQRNEKRVMINPEVIAADELIEVEEGCLSVQEYHDNVKRHSRVTVRAQDAHGEYYELEAEGLLAQCIQHETDHLNGKLFVDQLSRLKQQRIKKKLLKMRKAQQR